MRIAAPVIDHEPYVVDDLELRPSEYQVLVAGVRAGLTIREFQILRVLVERRDRVVQRAEVYSEVWGGQIPHRDRSVDVFVRKLRRKLALVSPRTTYIHTHFGVGYRYFPEPTAPSTRPDEPAPLA